jgi:predicted nucleotide-binding protein (sugar kinase/HSP70/actin superfamily)
MGRTMVYDQRIRHFHRPDETSFTADEREEVTILLGGLTWKHERLIQAVLQRNGYQSECLTQPDHEAHEIGKEYCGNNLCHPVYFTVGNLIKRLRELEPSGLSRAEIVRRYIFFTAGSSGPCRFGMYEAEFRSALAAANFSGFRVVLFLQDHGIKASSGQSGLQFSVDFGMGALHAFILGDLLNDLHRKFRAYESSQERLIVWGSIATNTTMKNWTKRLAGLASR